MERLGLVGDLVCCVEMGWDGMGVGLRLVFWYMVFCGLVWFGMATFWFGIRSTPKPQYLIWLAIGIPLL